MTVYIVLRPPARGRSITTGGLIIASVFIRGVQIIPEENRAVMPKDKPTHSCTDARPTDRVRSDCKLVGVWITTTCRRVYYLWLLIRAYSVHNKEVEIIIFIIATFSQSH